MAVYLVGHGTTYLLILQIVVSNIVHDFWEDCFRKPKLLLAADRLIYRSPRVPFT